MTKRYKFFAELIGDGDTVDDAWQDCVNALAEEPGDVPTFYEIADECEECHTELGQDETNVTACGKTLCEADYHRHNQDCSLCGIYP